MAECTDCKAMEQPYQSFLVRSHYRQDPAGRERAVNYRTKHYGYFKGFGDRSLNPNSPASQARETTFMGIPIKLHEAVIPSLRCVEKAILAGCQGPCRPDPKYPGECDLPHKKFPYKPTRLSGLRNYNSFRGGQVSNHVYGIAIDIDPALNACCGCVGKWKENRLCKSANYTKAYQRMVMPMCWVEKFEKYGWYWLGRDRLQDTMHFAFLGNPDKIRECKSQGLGTGTMLLLAGAVVMGIAALRNRR